MEVTWAGGQGNSAVSATFHFFQQPETCLQNSNICLISRGCKGQLHCFRLTELFPNCNVLLLGPIFDGSSLPGRGGVPQTSQGSCPELGSWLRSLEDPRCCAL